MLDTTDLQAGATPEGEDLSLFYGDKAGLSTITESRRFLPSDVYGALVRNAVVCCVDVVLVRKQSRTKEQGSSQKKECLLVQRSTEPVKGVWWWPGGRLLKGETFFDAAKRKAKEEVGIECVKPIQVLGVWNTFFPTSAWDSDELGRGTQTVNPIVLVEITDPNCDIRLDATSENHRWISLDPDLAKHEDPYVQQALLRLQAWNPEYIVT